MEGYIFYKRFLVQKKLAEGAYGLIYKGIDLETPLMDPETNDVLLDSNQSVVHRPIIIKFTQQMEVNDMEYKAMVETNEMAAKDGKPDLIVQTLIKGSAVVTDPIFVNSDVKLK